MPFHFPDGNANWLTNAALDKFAKAPEYKVCAIKIEKVKEDVKVENKVKEEDMVQV
jgi:hypothetical protein